MSRSRVAATSTGRPPRAPRLSGPERRSSIIRAAAEALVAEGPESISMEGVAARVGISKPVVYDHFPNRDALLLAIYDDYASHLEATVAAALDRAGESLDEIVRASIEGYYDAVEAKGYLVRVLTRAAPGEPGIHNARGRTRAGWVTFWTAKLREFGDLPEDLAHDAIVLITHMAEQSAGLWVDGPSTRKEAAELYTRITVAALRSLIDEEVVGR